MAVDAVMALLLKNTTWPKVSFLCCNGTCSFSCGESQHGGIVCRGARQRERLYLGRIFVLSVGVAFETVFIAECSLTDMFLKM